MKLNAEQEAAVSAREGAWLVSATAGSGKTEVLKRRVQALLDEGERLEDILVLTFTREAADNFERRLGVSVPKDKRYGFRTFHSFCLRLVKDEAANLPFALSQDPFPAGPEISKLLSLVLKECGVDRKEFKAVRGFISHHKRTREAPDAAHPFAACCSLYERRLREAGIIDFDDMILQSVNMLESNAGVRTRAQIKWLLCDESQDTDDLQFRLLQLLSEKHGNIMCVGDYNQALYGFRGAHPENLLNFERWFPQAKRIILPENFRSTPTVVKFAQENSPIQDDLTKAMRTANGDGPKVEFQVYADSTAEAVAAVNTGIVAPAHTAILARTNAQLASLETICIERNIKYHRLGRTGYWSTPEIKNLVALGNWALSGKAAETYQQGLIHTRKALFSLPAQQAVRLLVTEARLEYLYADQDDEQNDNFALENIRKASQIAGRFGTLREFLNHAQKGMHASRKAKNALTLGTVHGAKGLEWETVIVIGVSDGVLPHKKGDFAEEQRIWYVAITRPKTRLRVTCVTPASPFIKKYLGAAEKPANTDEFKVQLPLLGG